MKSDCLLREGWMGYFIARYFYWCRQSRRMSVRRG